MRANKLSINEKIVHDLLVAIGENPSRQGLIDTPKRVTRMWRELFKGYDKSNKPFITCFDNNTDGVSYNQMIVDSGHFFSHCEHHMVPFFGQYFFGYIPDKKVVGLSKVARIVDYFAARLQIQERLTKDVVDELEKTLKPKGIALVIKARHLCKEMRGVMKHDGEMITGDLRGAFINQETTKMEFLNYINNSKNGKV